MLADADIVCATLSSTLSFDLAEAGLKFEVSDVALRALQHICCGPFSPTR